MKNTLFSRGNPYSIVNTAKSTYNASIGEFVITEGSEVILPAPSSNEVVVVRSPISSTVDVKASSDQVEGNTRGIRQPAGRQVTYVADGDNWYVRNNIDYIGLDVPDISMFDNPIYHFTAGTSQTSYGNTGDFPEVLDDSVSDASPVNSPTLKNNFNSTGYDMFNYQPADDDAHTVSPDSEYSGNNKLSVFALVYPRDVSGTTKDSQFVMNVSDTHAFGFFQGNYCVYHTDNGNSSYSGNASANTLDTVGFTYNNGTGEIYGGGSNQKTFSTNMTIDGNNVRISSSTKAPDTDQYAFDGGIAEIIVCSGEETDSNYSTYHNDRV